MLNVPRFIFGHRVILSSERGKGSTTEVYPCFATSLTASSASAIGTPSYVVMPTRIRSITSLFS